MNRDEILQERLKWYSFTPALFEIVKCLKNRELCFLTLKTEEKQNKKAVRYLLAFSVDYLLKHFRWINFDRFLINLYHSVAKFKPEVPVFSYNLAERKKDERYQEFAKNYSKYVNSYNFFFDCDGKENFELCFKEAKQVKEILEEFKVPYYLLNSSLKGFHFVIPSDYMPKMDISKLLELLNDILNNIIGIYDFKAIDSSIIDLKRVQKVPYSYSVDGSICLPLNDEQFFAFSNSLVSMNNVLKGIQIRNRGVLLRTYGLDENTLKENTLKFLDEFR